MSQDPHTSTPPPADPPVENEAAAGIHAILDGWGQLLAPIAAVGRDRLDPKDKRFAGPEWEHPVFDLVRQGYGVMADAMMNMVDTVPGVDPAQKARMTFAMRTLVEAMSPANSPLTNPVALNKAIETSGASLATGFQNLMTDLQRGQLTHVSPTAFEVGVNIATTPGKVVCETPLFQLIQYTPTTPTVAKTPLVIFPPWINRFYILDLSPEKSFIRWAVAEGLTVFMVSWKSADASMKDVVWDDYVDAQIAAIDTVRDVLAVKSVHTVGYCVAGTTLAATLAVLTARGQAKKVKSATFFTAQVDFSEAGELLNFVDDANIAMIEKLSKDGYLDGRYLAMTFNLLRGRDLIWNNVVSNYLLGKDYPAFDLLYWNGDTTNLPAKWHKSYLEDLYRDNKLAKPGAIRVSGASIDLTTVKTPSYIQAGREDHIAPLASVWKITEHFTGPLRFVLAGSGHIAGVVNPPSAQKYQYWINENSVASLDEFIAGATETRGSWWPDWISWLRGFGADHVTAAGARIPGQGVLPAIEDAPGRYVRSR
ncbi:class I poly(R)-hydroxyalkanoic acid synthase [Sphingomonas sp.]|uniref:PHA/PHB synthase family protein n=1 Tax=Sphingomonas sp. TaxID=28214 RepID=UPI0025E9FCBD|nr:class I poly(R)-hydroxyalkanoic acid synthase [Sphingomonas sp.]